MKSFIGKFLACLSILTLSLGLAQQAPAQDAAKPVLVVSLSSLNEMLGDVAAMTKLADQENIGQIAVGMAGLYTVGLDKTRPSGLVVSLDGVEPKAIAFVPVTDLPKLLNVHKQTIGTPKDVGNGVLEIGSDRPQPIYVKEQNGWAFIGQSSTQLQNLPKDPSLLLGGLDKQYDIAVQVNLGNLPAELRDLAVSQLKAGYEASLAAQAQNLDPNERKQAEMVGNALVKNMVMYIEETDQLTIGLALDAKTKKTALEFGITAKAGSQLAKTMAGIGKVPSSLHGFVLPESAASFIGATPIAPQDIEQTKEILRSVQSQAMKAIDNDAGLPNAEARDAVKDLVGTIMKVLEATVESGKTDAAGSVKLGKKSLTLVGGLGVVGGDKIEAALKKVVAVAKANAGGDVPEVKFNYATHGSVNLHKVLIPLAAADQPVRDLFGANLEVILGTAKDGLYLALGNDGESTLKSSLDSSAQQKAKPAPASELQVAVSPIAKFASSLDSDPQLALVAAASEKYAGKDHVTLNARSVERGLTYRLEVEEGVIQFIGEVVKAAQGR